MEKFYQSIVQLIKYIPDIGIGDVLDILIVAALLYLVLDLTRKTRAYTVLKGIIMLIIALGLSDAFQLHTINFLLRKMVEVGLLALIILFQPELRRFLERLGTRSTVLALFGTVDTSGMEKAIDQTVLAACEMSESKTGALIIFEQNERLTEQVRTGTMVDADVTAELLKNIFYPKAPLHDGAVIIRDGRILAAGCVLPLSGNTNLSKELGTRHRAGIGMSENSDAVVIIVSEETGAISVAKDGMLKRHLTREVFEKLLRSELLDEETEQTALSRFTTFLRKGDKE